MEIPALADLLDLQEVDLQIDRLLEKRQAMPELAQYRETNASRKEAEARLEDAQARLRDTDLQLDKSEGELSMLEAKLDETETRLFAGGMSSRETEHKRLEVQSLKSQQDALEEKVLGFLDTREELQGEVTAIEGEVEALRGAEQELESVIAAAWKDIDLEIGRREARKGEIVPTIPAELLERYEKLRRTKEGVAVGRLDNGREPKATKRQRYAVNGLLHH